MRFEKQLNTIENTIEEIRSQRNDGPRITTEAELIGERFKNTTYDQKISTIQTKIIT